MNRNHIVDLLSAASGYDRRTIGEIDVAAWSEAARRKNWNFDTALEAIHEFYAEPGGKWIMPGDITAHHRTNPTPPSAQTVDQALPLTTAPPATPEHRAKLMNQIRKLAKSKSLPNS